MWCIGKLDSEYVYRMEHLIDLYNSKYNEKEPVVCVDEKSKQLIKDTREPIKATKNRIEKIDYEYKRNGVRNIFVSVEPLGGKRVLSVTKHRKKADFVEFITKVVDSYPLANKIHIVLDNLNTHFKKSFYDVLNKEDSDKLLSKIEFHYTPKHGSWLNMAEIEISALDRQCIKGRISDETELVNRINSWTNDRNLKKKKINWKFTKEDANGKLRSYYV